MTPRVLLAEDDAALRMVLGRALPKVELTATGDGSDARRLLHRESFDVAVFDLRLPGCTGLELLAEARGLPSPPHVIVITAQNTMSNAIEAMKGGAYDYLCKPFDLDEFEALVHRAGEDRAAAFRMRPLADGPLDAATTRTLYGRSPAMQRVFKNLGRAAPSPHSVLITGESGTGKELVARILHQESPRGAGPFVAMNAAAIPNELLEADLFGHARGAFTGAQGSRSGKFHAASNGTLFLDEIGEMPLSLQAKLLRVLETKSFYPVGADREVKVDVRIVAATNRDLSEEVRAGRFRGDLFYRLNVLTVELPPLRDRLEDIPLLAEWLLEKNAREHGGPQRELAEDALDWLREYTWPGNVRELENMLVRASTFAQGPVIRGSDLSGPRASSGRRPGSAEDESFEAMIRRRLGPVVRSYPEPTAKGQKSDLHPLVVGTAERVLLELVLARMNGNQLKAAKLLGINRNTLKRKLDEHGIDAGGFKS
jgi:two-component system, NtrC family, nitrogen regulation response regulator GlnG